MNISEFYLLEKEGFTPMKIRKIFGEWEYLAYTNKSLDDRWERLPQSEEVILEQIKKYGRKLYE